jgi:hypothetical protein
MNSAQASDHDHGVVVAENGLGKVSVCPCGVLTLTVACVSLRFEPAAFQQLAQLVGRVPRDDLAVGAAIVTEAGCDGSPVH